MSFSGNWRLEPGLKSYFAYKKRFAILPKQCVEGEYVWFEYYYKKYEIWGSDGPAELGMGHTDFIENITEADYIVRRLIEGF